VAKKMNGRDAKYSLKVNLIEAGAYLTVIVLAEIAQVMWQETLWQAVTDAIFLFFVYLLGSSSAHPVIGRTIVLSFCTFEVISWRLTKRGVCLQAIWALIDWQYVWRVQTSMVYIGAAGIVVLFIIVRLKTPAKCWVTVRMSRYVILTFTSVVGFTFARSIRHTLWPDELRWNVRPTNPYIREYMLKKAKLNTLPPKRKNLIMLHLECLERMSIGLFNEKHRDLMPTLSSLAANGTAFSDVRMQDNQDYTVGSVFSLNSGVPLAGGWNTDNKGSTFICRLVHSIQDYLHIANYNQVASCTGFCSLWLYYKEHHMTIKHGPMTDQPHVHYLVDKLLPSLAQKKPFGLIVHIESTHPFFTIEKECEREIPNLSDYPRSMRAVQCVDLYVKKIYDRIIELGLDKDTVLVIYGDHQLWMEPEWYGAQPRKLLMVMPFEKHGIINKTVSWFDFPPTVMKLLGFDDYEPKFPFGRDMFSPEMGIAPTEEDRIFIQNTCLVYR
jgi:hypothetical protein